MALVRILVDGYSLLHNWPELAPGRARHSAAAREALVQRLTQYQDASGIPVTVFFDGSGAPPHTPKPEATHQVEVLFSRNGRTADEMIERAAYRFQEYGEVLAITDDLAERQTVVNFGGMAQSCATFIATVQATLGDLGRDLQRHNRREHQGYQTHRAAPRRDPRRSQS